MSPSLVYVYATHTHPIPSNHPPHVHTRPPPPPPPHPKHTHALITPPHTRTHTQALIFHVRGPREAFLEALEGLWFHYLAAWQIRGRYPIAYCFLGGRWVLPSA